MLRDNENHWLRRGIADFAMAIALFWAVAFYVHGAHNRAHAVTVPKTGGEASSMQAQARALAMWVCKN